MNLLKTGAWRSPLLLLLLLLLGLASLITALDWRDRTADANWTLQTADTVQNIEIRSELPSDSAGITRLTRHPAGWTLSRQLETTDGGHRDIDVPANADRVAPLLALLQLPRRDNYHVDDIELAELGLAPPQASVELDNIKFLFGDKTLDGTARYVQVENRIHLYQEFLFPLLKAGPDIFVADKATSTLSETGTDAASSN